MSILPTMKRKHSKQGALQTSWVNPKIPVQKSQLCVYAFLSVQVKKCAKAYWNRFQQVFGKQK